MTKRYAVTMQITGYAEYIVEAESEDDAANKAWDLFSYNQVDHLEHEVSNIEEIQ